MSLKMTEWQWMDGLVEGCIDVQMSDECRSNVQYKPVRCGLLPIGVDADHKNTTQVIRLLNVSPGCVAGWLAGWSIALRNWKK